MERSVAAVLAGLALLVGSLSAAWRLVVALPAPETIPSPATVILGGVVLGFAAQVPAGFVTGRLSPRSPIRHGAVVAVLAAILGGGVMSATGTATFELGVGLNVLQAPGILLGAWLQARAGDE